MRVGSSRERKVLMTSYDFIGDIHGEGNKLEGLLRKMGYEEVDGVFRHPDRQAIFVGDYVDRGDHHLKALAIVKAMVEAGSARAVMGNHEFNAIGYATLRSNGPGFLRSHSEKNTKQHQAFLDQVGVDEDLYATYIEWFKTLPMWIEEESFCAVHACWQPDTIAQLTAAGYDGGIGEGATMKALYVPWDEFPGSAVETILKGPEFPVKEFGNDGRDGYFNDKGGHSRHMARLRWWLKDATSYAELADIPEGTESNLTLPTDRGPEDLLRVTYGHPTKPTFFGHYWRTGDQTVIGTNAVCVDYSAVKDAKNPLVAYQFTPGEPLSDDNFIGFVRDEVN